MVFSVQQTFLSRYHGLLHVISFSREIFSSPETLKNIFRVAFVCVFVCYFETNFKFDFESCIFKERRESLFLHVYARWALRDGGVGEWVKKLNKCSSLSGKFSLRSSKFPLHKAWIHFSDTKEKQFFLRKMENVDREIMNFPLSFHHFPEKKVSQRKSENWISILFPYT